MHTVHNVQDWWTVIYEKCCNGGTIASSAVSRPAAASEYVAADRLDELGYTREAEIVRGHMKTMTYHEVEHVTEADLLYISDRMVLEDTFVGLDRRYAGFREKMLKRGYNPDSEFAIWSRTNSYRFVQEIEQRTGRSVMDICGNDK